MNGLELMRAVFEGDLPTAGIVTLLGMEPLEVERGRVSFALEPGPQHGNPLGTTHGGVHATMLDSAMGCAVHTELGEGDMYTTLELSVNYLRPVMAGAGRIVAEGATIHVGGRVAMAEGRVLGPDGKLVAHGKTTCLITRAGKD